MNFKEKKALVMGLGLHGGGLESARFLLKRGAEVSVTDLRDEAVLKPSIEKLDTICRVLGSQPVRYVLGRHEIEDFRNADVVIKNPGVRPDSPFLQAAKNIETDISLFLNENRARLFAVTGTKGKSGTAAALHHILNQVAVYREQSHLRSAAGGVVRKVFLGGNITVSPLTFLDELTEYDDVVLELSSFQLGDLRGRTKKDGSPLLKPKVAVLTAIMEDHLDRYASMDEYINDKREIYRGQDSSCITVAGDDEWGRSFLSETNGKKAMYNLKAGFSNFDLAAKLLPEKLLVPGEHQRINLFAASLAVYTVEGESDETAEAIRNALATYKGIEHRLEFFHEINGIRFFNDSAATVPQAAAACIEALSKDAPLVLVTGGTDKNLDFSPLAETAPKAEALVLLAGTGSDKLARLLSENGISYEGPFDDIEKAVACAFEKACELKKTCSLINVALSPGCASFGMFLNEFDRGRKWKEAVVNLAKL